MAMSDLEVIEDLFRQGLSYKQIQDRTGYSKSKVYYAAYTKLGLEKRGQVKKPLTISQDKINKVIRLTNWGYKIEEIAEGEYLRVSQVRKIIELHGSGNIKTI